MLVSAVRSIAACASILVAAAALPARAETWPSSVNAVYNISFNGIDIGQFEFQSSVNGATYAANGVAQITALLGVIQWQGVTHVSGSANGDTIKPAGYTFDYRSSARAGSIKMGFGDAGVSNLSIVPPSPPPEDVVPVREQHLKDVFDPLSAVLAVARGSNGNPCARRIPIFDGKQRFDLQLSLLRQERVTDARFTGQPKVGFVCRVRYMPIAGHKRGSESEQMMSENSGIEIALRPVPSANIFVPYRITVPTFAGSAVLTSQRVEIVTPGQARIALMQ